MTRTERWTHNALKLARILCLAMAAAWTAVAATACQLKGDHAVIVMIDFQRPEGVRKTDIAILKRLSQIYAGFRSTGGIVRTQLMNFDKSNLSTELDCRFFVKTKFIDALGQIQTLYGVAMPPESIHFGRATALESEFRDMLLSLGALQIEASTQKTLIIFSNLDYFFTNSTNAMSSRGHFLNQAWLTSEISPFVRDVLEIDTDRFQGTRVFVVTDGSDSLSVRNGKREFFATFFRALGGDLYHFGPAYSFLNGSNSLLENKFALMMQSRLEPVPVPQLADASLLQIVNRSVSRNISPGDFRN